jgi:hypothetical protein
MGYSMIIYLHFQHGTTTINNGEYSGYDYSRTDKLITAHIHIDSLYHLIIDHHSITARYKYITVRYGHGFNIGRWSYPWHCIESYRGSEVKHLNYLCELVHELIEHESIHGKPVENWRVIQLTSQYKDDDTTT